MTLDTGAETTDLNANFARQFAREIQDVGRKSSTRVEGLGGSTDIESITVPKLDFLIGGKSADASRRECHAAGELCTGGPVLHWQYRTGPAFANCQSHD
jgi:hypothetical protein